MEPRGRHRRGYTAVVGVSALSIVAAAAMSATPALADTKPGPAKSRLQAHKLPEGVTGGGSFKLGTQHSQAEKVDRSLAGAKGAVDVMIELDAAPASTAFTKARTRGISTPSAAQVARGLNREGQGTWRRYREQMTAILPLLDPWVQRFGYELS
jgi:hypothetical protein